MRLPCHGYPGDRKFEREDKVGLAEIDSPQGGQTKIQGEKIDNQAKKNDNLPFNAPRMWEIHHRCPYFRITALEPTHQPDDGPCLFLLLSGVFQFSP